MCLLRYIPGEVLSSGLEGCFSRTDLCNGALIFQTYQDAPQLSGCKKNFSGHEGSKTSKPTVSVNFSLLAFMWYLFCKVLKNVRRSPGWRRCLWKRKAVVELQLGLRSILMEVESQFALDGGKELFLQVPAGPNIARPSLIQGTTNSMPNTHQTLHVIGSQPTNRQPSTPTCSEGCY